MPGLFAFNNRFVFNRLDLGIYGPGLHLSYAPPENCSSLPEMCKWNAFTIDSPKLVCDDGQLTRENIFHIDGAN
jgi:hypothetical protein